MKMWSVGWRLALGASGFVVLNGLLSLVSTLVSLIHGQRPWLTGAGAVQRSMAELTALDPQLASYWVVVNIVAWANLTATGVVMVGATWFGVRQRKRWGWWVLLGFLLWVGAMDSFAVLFVYFETGRFIPTAPVIAVVGVAVLSMTWRGVFRGPSPE